MGASCCGLVEGPDAVDGSCLCRFYQTFKTKPSLEKDQRGEAPVSLIQPFLSMKTIRGAPLGLRVARTMSRSQMRGAGMLTRLLTRFGRLDRIATYDLGTVEFRVPLGRIPWDFPDVMLYEAKLIESFAKAVDALQ